MRKLWLALVCCLSVPLNVSAEGQRAKFEPPDGRVLLMVGQDKDTINEYVGAVGIVPGGSMVYTSIQQLEGLTSQADHGSGPMHASALVKRYPQAAIQMGLSMVGALEGLPQGAYDGNIDKLAQWLKHVRVPVFLRIGYEFDGPHNHYDPRQYQGAYRYLVDALRQREVRNVATVWHSYASGTPHSLEAWYPGDTYVDWVGLSYFDQPEDLMEPVVQFAKQHHKPLMIAEATPRGIGTGMDDLSWKAWFHLMFSFAERQHVKAISYINSNWEAQPMWRGQGWGDAQVQANAFVKAAWLKELAQPKYLQASPELFTILGDSPD